MFYMKLKYVEITELKKQSLHDVHDTVLDLNHNYLENWHPTMKQKSCRV